MFPLLLCLSTLFQFERNVDREIEQKCEPLGSWEHGTASGSPELRCNDAGRSGQ